MYLGYSKKNQLDGYSLSREDMCVLLQNMSVRALELFGRLERNSMQLEIGEYFKKHYGDLRKLIYLLEHDYPDMDERFVHKQ